jgi:hypothetical protein
MTINNDSKRFEESALVMDFPMKFEEYYSDRGNLSVRNGRLRTQDFARATREQIF